MTNFWFYVKARYTYYLAVGTFFAVTGLLFNAWTTQLLSLVLLTLGYFGSQHDDSLSEWAFDNEEIP